MPLSDLGLAKYTYRTFDYVEKQCANLSEAIFGKIRHEVIEAYKERAYKEKVAIEQIVDRIKREGRTGYKATITYDDEFITLLCRNDLGGVFPKQIRWKRT